MTHKKKESTINKDHAFPLLGVVKKLCHLTDS